MPQDPLNGSIYFTVHELWDLVFSPLHVRLRMIDGYLRLACLLFIDSPICLKILKEQYDHFFHQIQQAYLNRGDGYKALYIKYATPDGGNTLNGKGHFFSDNKIIIILLKGKTISHWI